MLISGIVVGAVVLIGGALTIYAYFNLSSIVARNEKRIVARVSDGLGRRVEVGKIQAQMGWGVSVEISGLTIADDPAFSPKPFLAASDVLADIEFFPLLRGRARVTKLHLLKPDIRIIMNANGDLNLDSLGSRPDEARKAEHEPSPHAHRRSSLGELSITALGIEDGQIFFNDRGEKASPIRVNHVDLNVTNFNAASAFDVDAKFAFPGDTQNVEGSGKLGPLLTQGVLDGSAIPVDVKVKLDSIQLDTLRPLADIGSNIPPALSVTDAANVSGTLSGTIGTLAIALNTDLTANHVAYAPIFDKPSGTAMTVNTSAVWGDHLGLTSINLKLFDLDVTASKFSGGGTKPFSVQIDSNSFNLANLSTMISGTSQYGLAGMGEVHSALNFSSNPPAMNGTVTLKQFAVKLPSWTGGVTDLNSTVQLADGIEVVEPTSFMFGSAHANLAGRVESLNPLKASYTLTADSVKLAQILASRPPGDTINGLAVKGTADGAIAAPRISAAVQSTDGSLQNVSYRNLEVTAAYFDHRASARSLKVEMFEGSLAADGDAIFNALPAFNLTLVMQNINMEQALHSQKIGAASTVRGFLSGNVAATGSGSSWQRIKPTLRGSGRLSIANGKLVGVNIVADALNAVAKAPGVSQLVNVAFVSSHHGLLVDPDTELQSASMSFQQVGPRFTTHDLFVQSPDYAITGDGWFDMDKNISMNSDIKLTLGLQVAIPVCISGKLPHVLVLPDVPTLAERVAMGAINTPGNIIRGGVNAVGSMVGKPQAGSGIPSIPNPINALKNLIP